jgi:hypothetical protein
MMPDNCLDWYMEPIPRKVKCFMFQAISTKKLTRMFSHLGYEGPSDICDKGVFMCQRDHETL